MSRPRLFVGSSSEGYEIAQAVQVNLERVCEVELWAQGSFGLTYGTLESLVKVANEFDFAILVLTPDDLEISRGNVQVAARNNVLFELGLFIGSLGRNRTFILHGQDQPPTLPSDLAGVTAATFAQPSSQGNFIASLGAPCTRIQRVINELGSRRTAFQDIAGWLPSLRDGNQVSYKEAVCGVVVGLSGETEVWLLVQVSFDDSYWPQRKISVGIDGTFRTEAQFGRGTTQDVGAEYIPMLVAASPTAGARFRESRDAGSSLLELPSGTRKLAQAIVIRR